MLRCVDGNSSLGSEVTCPTCQVRRQQRWGCVLMAETLPQCRAYHVPWGSGLVETAALKGKHPFGRPDDCEGRME